MARSRSSLQSIQALRAIAILLVVFLHLAGVADQHRPIADARVAWAGVGHAGVDLFFVISGFIMYLIGHRQLAGWPSGRRFLYRRAARVYLPYWLWFTVALLVYLTAPQIMLLTPGQLTGLVESFVLIPTWTPQLLPVSWTLKYELYFYAICTLILILPRPYRLSAAVAWLLYMLSGQWLCSQPSETPCGKGLFLTMHPILFEFVLGALVGFAYEKRAYPTWVSGYLFAVGLSIMLGAFAAYLLFGIDLDQSPWNRVLLFGAPAAVVVFGATLAERDRQREAPQWLARLGDASYSYYLSHLLVIQAVFLALAPMAWIPTLLIVGIAFGASLIVAHWGYRYAERPLLEVAYKDPVNRSDPSTQP